jgi:hypothetical protein
MKHKAKGFIQNIIPTLPCSSLDKICYQSLKIDILKTSYMVNIPMFFNTKSQGKSALTKLNQKNEVVKIWTNSAKLQYVVINCKDLAPPSIDGNMIYPANQKKKKRLLGCLFDPKELQKSLTTQAENSVQMNAEN